VTTDTEELTAVPAQPIEAYPYRTWVGLPKQQRWRAMLAAGYHPGSGRRLGDTGTCGGCKWLVRHAYPPLWGTRERVVFRCGLPVMLAEVLGGRQVRKKWPGCRSFEPKGD
jgi:hypothetical protein